MYYKLLCAAAICVVNSVTALVQCHATEAPTARLDPPFLLEQSDEGITRLRRHGDRNEVDFLRPDAVLGRVELRARAPGGNWRNVERNENDIHLASELELKGRELIWQIRVKNRGDLPVEIGDLKLPLPMNTDYPWGKEDAVGRRVFKHAFIAGHGSFLYWLPVKGTGPLLVMLPPSNTSLEFFESHGYRDFAGEEYAVFVHSKAAAQDERRGSWRQPRTSRLLAPDEEARYVFTFHWANDYEDVRDLLFQNNGVDIHVAPGMVIPEDLDARLALRTKRKIQEIEAEFPDETTIEAQSSPAMDQRVFRVKFRRLGENRLTVHFSDGGSMPLEYFVTQPLETLIKKRANFIVRNQQHRDPTEWYNGLFSLWDVRMPEGKNLLGPDNMGGQPPFVVSGSDDPSNCKCLLVAEKNVAFPEAAEIKALEYFVKNFVWGKHQRTDEESPYPCGIYGSDSWYQNRFTDRDPLEKGVSRPGGPSACRMWRTYDYTTYFALYFDLYRIAKQRPDLVRDLDAETYLERAYATARAYFKVPANIYMDGWQHTGWVYWQYNSGNFHEKYLLPLITALEEEGHQAKADFLRGEWEKKVKYFIYDDPWPFASEMPIDSTAFETTYAVADYALSRVLKPDSNLWYDRNLKRWFSHPIIDHNKHEEFMQRQHAANLACRGVLEANYWSLGSDFRGSGSANLTLSYMSQMGGWSVLDYALRHDPDPANNLRLGYASMLSSWALMNAGDPQSNYGFWSPGQRHDGSVQNNFQPQQFKDYGNEHWRAYKDFPRGPWPFCSDIDHGLLAAIECARTVVFQDPIFGLIAYGGELVDHGNTIDVKPRDGVRQRFSALLDGRRLHIELDRDGFADDQPITIGRDLESVTFAIESRGAETYKTKIEIIDLSPGPYILESSGESQVVSVDAGGRLAFDVVVRENSDNVVALQKRT